MHNCDKHIGESGLPDCNTGRQMPAIRFTLRKEEKLRHRSLIETLFKEGNTIYEFPLRMTWRDVDSQTLSDSFRDKIPQQIGSIQMLITVPKKKRRHAVDRVLIRRRIREAYRLNRSRLQMAVDRSETIRTLSIAFIYIHDKNLPFSTIERKTVLLLQKLSDIIGSKSSN